MAARRLTDAEIGRFKRDGYLQLRAVLDPALCAQARAVLWEHNVVPRLTRDPTSRCVRFVGALVWSADAALRPPRNDLRGVGAGSYGPRMSAELQVGQPSPVTHCNRSIIIDRSLKSIHHYHQSLVSH